MSLTGSTSDQARQERKGRFFLGCFFTVFMLVGLGAALAFLWPITEILSARNWQATPCTIVESKVVEHRSSKGGSTYSVAISYRYEVDDRPYVSTRYKFMTGSSSGQEGKQAVVDRFRPGTEAVCYVSRRDPSQAVIEPGFTADILFGLIPLIFAAIGGGGLIGMAVYRKKRPAAGTPGLPPPVRTGPVTLNPAASPTGRLIFSLIFALIWNGIVSIFLVQVVTGWRSGHGDGCATVFLIPFLLVGLGVIVLAVYYFLALFNPRPTLKVSAGAAALGDSVDLDWETQGSVDRVKSFTITLEGREEATYRRGTSTSTDKSTFARIELVSSPRGKDLRRGKVKVAIPAGTMHTFRSRNNRILWSFHVKGDIPRWPDVNEEFAFEVLPQRVTSGPSP
jgi:hypothetical protein